jgi:hypothetical protein
MFHPARLQRAEQKRSARQRASDRAAFFGTALVQPKCRKFSTTAACCSENAAPDDIFSCQLLQCPCLLIPSNFGCSKTTVVEFSNIQALQSPEH